MKVRRMIVNACLLISEPFTVNATSNMFPNVVMIRWLETLPFNLQYETDNGIAFNT